jgi:Protein phosphatase 2C
MNSTSWRWISASVKGTSHLKAGTECQDRHLCTRLVSQDGSILLLIVSDGAGSAKRAAEGAQLACETVRDEIARYFDEQGKVSEINSRLVAHWIEVFRSEVILLADAEGLSEKEFACTLIGAVVGFDSAAFFQVGDGAAVFSLNAGGPYRLAFWPERGEYENTTYFATQPNFIEQLQFLLVEAAISEIGLMSDGLQRLALNYQTQQPHSPFFNGLFPAVRSSSEADLAIMNDKLSTYLDSSKVNERTDDDKTLVLAVAG